MDFGGFKDYVTEAGWLIIPCPTLCTNAHHLRELEKAIEQDSQTWAKKMKSFLEELNINEFIGRHFAVQYRQMRLNPLNKSIVDCFHSMPPLYSGPLLTFIVIILIHYPLSASFSVVNCQRSLAVPIRTWDGHEELLIPPLSFDPHKFDLVKIKDSDRAKIQTYVNKLQKDRGSLVLFRGQRELTPQILAAEARENGLTTATAELKRELEVEEARRLARIAEAEKNFFTKDRGNEWLYDEQRQEFLERLNYLKQTSAKDALVLRHVKTVNGTFFVSATRSLTVALGNFQGGEGVRYVYILLVPQHQTVNIYGIGRKTNSTSLTNEVEFSVVLDATPYVVGIFDLVEGGFIPFKDNFSLPN